MKNLRNMHFSETDNWKKVVWQTYRLPSQKINLFGSDVHIFDNGKMLANSPYISHAGNSFAGSNGDLVTISALRKPLLIKSKIKIDIPSGCDHFLVEDYFTFLLDLSKGKDYVWNNLIKAKTRTHVRKAEKMSAQIKFGRNELLDDFYAVISEAWRDLGTPTHSKDFYGNIIKNLNGSDGWNSGFLVIYLGGIAIASACFIYDRESIHHPYSATLNKYKKHSLNSLVYWNLILFAISKNINTFDMGRSRLDQGTSTYKKGWGAQETQLYYYYFNKKYHSNEEDGKLIQFLINMWKKLPLSVANFLGPKLIYKVLK